MATTIRAAIMLAVLMGLPAAWVYYGPLPDRAQMAVDRFVGVAKEAVGWLKHDPAPTAQVAASGAPEFADPLTAEAAIPTLAQRLEPRLARLRTLGVEEYVLEPWGAGNRLYRFRCEMPLAAGGQATEQFEAVAADPQASIEQVVADVSSWQTARAGGTILR